VPTQRPLIGWREWVHLPDLEGTWVKAKVDTGARTSAIHATRLEPFTGYDGRDWLRFTLHPTQHGHRHAVRVAAPVVDRRVVRSSSGEEEVRPVVVTRLTLLGHTWPVEVTLTRRDRMGFRMLLGRAAVRRHYFIDPGRSYLGGKRDPSPWPNE